jgi:SAM-dependent methyltransferase
MDAFRLLHKLLLILLGILGGLAFFWLVPLKLLSRLAARFGKSAPCPASLAWLVDNPIRRRYMRVTLDRVGVQPGECVLELGPGPGTFTVTNVETHVASAYDLPLDDGSVDRAFLVTVLPEVPDQARALAELYRVLKPGGVLSITEEFTDPDYAFALETIRRVEAVGFRQERRYGNFWVYTINFRVDKVRGTFPSASHLSTDD